MTVRAWRNLFSFAVMLAAFLLQTVVLPVFGCTTVAPDLLLAALLAISVQHGFAAGMAMGAGFGLVMDVLYTDGVGLYALCYVLAAGLFHLWGSRFSTERFLPQVPVLLAGIVGKEVLQMAVLYLSRHTLRLGTAVLSRMLLSAGLTLVCALLLWLVVDLVYEHMRHREIRGY